jgi:hypothetical protein
MRSHAFFGKCHSVDLKWSSLWHLRYAILRPLQLRIGTSLARITIEVDK